MRNISATATLVGKAKGRQGQWDSLTAGVAMALSAATANEQAPMTGVRVTTMMFCKTNGDAEVRPNIALVVHAMVMTYPA
jgi:hypothetical protein